MWRSNASRLVLPALMPGIHVFLSDKLKEGRGESPVVKLGVSRKLLALEHIDDALRNID
jgi:hypothetical protein